MKYPPVDRRGADFQDSLIHNKRKTNRIENQIIISVALLSKSDALVPRSYIGARALYTGCFHNLLD